MNSVVVALSAVFFAIILYTWLMGSRQKRLERKLDDIRDQLKDRL
jgi:CcmD family protein